jgi:hypothetical protein
MVNFPQYSATTAVPSGTSGTVYFYQTPYASTTYNTSPLTGEDLYQTRSNRFSDRDRETLAFSRTAREKQKRFDARHAFRSCPPALLFGELPPVQAPKVRLPCLKLQSHPRVTFHERVPLRSRPGAR